MLIRKFLIFYLLLSGVETFAANRELVVKGKDSQEQANYAVSRYIFNGNKAVRTTILEHYFEQSDNDLQLLFATFDSVRNENVAFTENVIQQFSSTEKYSSVIKLLQLRQVAEKGNMDSALNELEFPIENHSIIDTAAAEYQLKLGAWICEETYNAEGLLEYSQRLFQYRMKYLRGDASYRSYRHIAYAYEKAEVLDSCLKYYELALEIARVQNDSVGLFTLNMDMGIYYSNQGQRAIALEYFSESMKFTPVVSKRKEAILYINTTINYRVLERHDIAESYLRKAEQIAQEIGDVDLVGHVYRNWVSQFGASGNLDSIPKYVRLSKAHFVSRNNNYGLGHLLVDYAQYFQEKGNYDSCMYWLNAANMQFETINYNAGLFHSETKRFIFLVAFERWDAAYKLGNKLLRENEKYRDEEAKLDILEGLARVYANTGKYKSAYHLKDSAQTIKAKLEGIETARKINMMRIQVEKERNAKLQIQKKFEQENRIKAEQELKIQESLTIYSTTGFVLVVVLLILVMFFYVRMRKEKERVVRLGEQKEDLMNVVAHDLLSPISKVSALAYLIRNTEDEDEKNQYFDLIETTLNDGTEMVRNLLDIHSAENEKLEVSTKKVRVSELIEDATLALKQRAASKQIVISDKIINDQEIYIDQRLLKRIIDNLITNAIKFSNPSTQIHFTATVEKQELTLKFQDEGPGFSEADKKKLYTKFGKLSARPTGDESSNGLGLAIVNELVKILKGSIELTSKKGEGATFVVTIPVKY